MKYIPNSYLAFELDELSRVRLLNAYTPKYSRIVCHHVTIEHRITEASYQQLMVRYGVTPNVEVIGRSAQGGVDCLSVMVNGGMQRPAGGYFHITHSLQPPHRPVESNALLVKLKGQPMETAVARIKVKGLMKLISL